MKCKVQVVLEDNEGNTTLEDIIELTQSTEHGHCCGLSLQNSKVLLKNLQEKIILYQASAYTNKHRSCPDCKKRRRIKEQRTIQYRTLFGTVVIPNHRLYHCQCNQEKKKTLSILSDWLPEHISPELQYIETRWGSYMSFQKTADLLSDVLPISPSHNKVTIRNHLHKTAKRQEAELEEKPFCISGCQNDWAKLPKPDKPITVGIDGGYVRSCANKKKNFEVIIGKSFSKTKPTKRFGLVQALDEKPQRRLLSVLRSQGMQENQQMIFLSDGAENVRNLQFIMHPESEHVLDWFHLTMRFTMLNQFAKGLVKADPEAGKKVIEKLESAKRYLWHGNVEKGMEKLDDCDMICCDEELTYSNQKKMKTQLSELMTYIENNENIIPNYGEKYRYGETITSSFVESTVNEVVTKRMVKKQQMQWSQEGAHYLLQARTATLNGDLPEYFERWYAGIKINDSVHEQPFDLREAA